MKFAVVILACLAAASAQFNAFNKNKNFYQPNYGQYQPQTLPPFRFQRPVTPTYTPIVYTTPAPAPVPVPVVPAKYYNGDARSAETLKLGNEINPDGSYNYFYETTNGIAAQEQGVPRSFAGNPPVAPVVAQGSFSWTSPEGQPIAISYVADENGYQPTGSAIPTSPPVPEAILRSLDYIARNAPKN